MADVTKTIIPFGVTGADEVKRDLNDIADTADKTAARLEAIEDKQKELNRAVRAADVQQVNTDRAQAKLDAQNKKVATLGAQLAELQGGGQGISDPVGATKAFFEAQKWQQIAEKLQDQLNPLRVAQRAYNAEIQTAAELLQRNAIDQEVYEMALERAQAELRRATGAEREQQLALAERQRAEQEALAAQQRYQAGLDTLLDRLEPARIAQRALNAELDEARKYYEAGALSEEQYAAARAQAQQRHDVATGVIDPAEIRREADEMNRLKAVAEQLRGEMNPLHAITTQYNAAVAQADELLRRNIFTETEHAAAVERATQLMMRERAELAANGASAGQQRYAIRDLSYQLQDLGIGFSMAAQSSEPFKMVLMTITQQAPQVVQGIQMLRGEAGGFLGFLGGPWGAAIMAGGSILATLAMKFFDAGDAAEKSANKIDTFADALQRLRTTPMEALGKLNANVLTAQGKLNNALAMPQNGRGAAIARAIAIQDAQQELQNAQSELDVATQTSKTNEKLFQIRSKAGRLRAGDIKGDDEDGSGGRRKSGRGRTSKKEKAEPSYWTQFFDDYTAARKDVVAQLAQQAKDDQARIMAARVRDGEPQHAALSDFSGRALEYQRAMALADAERSGDQDRIRRQLLLNELDQRNIDLTDEQIGQVLEWRKEEEEAAKQADRHRQAWQQLREDGAQALDTLLNPDNITHWGDTFRQVLRQVLFDLEKLTLINPLENLLFGGNRATLGGAKSGGGGLGGLLTSVLGGLFGKASPQASLASSATETIAGNPGLFADGTQSAPGGWAVVGERGRELVKLPRGAGVLTASRTRAALAESGGGQPVHVSLTLDARGAGPREVEALQAQVDRLRREFPAIAVQAVASARQRRVIA